MCKKCEVYEEHLKRIAACKYNPDPMAIYQNSGDKLLTGDPSTLGTYKKIATLFGDKAVKFIQSKIDASPNGEDEIVIADESQMLMLFASMLPNQPIQRTVNHR